MPRIGGFLSVGLALLSLAVSLLMTGVAQAAPKGNDKVQAELLSNVKQVRAGQPFWVGIRLHIQPQWHIYWVNPGDAGQATSVTWDLPAGFKAEALQFPVPQRFDDGGVVTFGYSDDVMLMARITPPENFASADAVKISAKVDWLVCKDVCLPGEQKVELKLPISTAKEAAADSDNAALFEQWLARVPVACSDQKGSIASFSYEAGTSDGVAVNVKWSNSGNNGSSQIKNVQLFPILDSAVVISDLKVGQVAAGSDGSSTLRFSYKPTILQGLTPASNVVQWVVAYDDAQGQRRGVSLAVPMATAKAGAAASK